MPTHVRIIVLSAKADGTSTPFDDADVVLKKKAELGTSHWPHDDLSVTHINAASRYVSIVGNPFEEPEDGEYLLVARAKKHATVVQRVTFSVKNDIVQVRSGWSGEASENKQVATISIVNYGEQKTRSQAPPKQSLLTITLHPPRHLVFIASLKKDADYNILGDDRRAYLYEVGELNPGAVHIRVSARTKDILVFAKSASASSGGWTQVGELPSLSGSTPTIEDYYRVLHDVGTRLPGSVIEGAFHGHAWHGGPIVWNTGDANELVAQRDPNDADARCKDWLPDGVIAKTYPALKNAFAKDGRFFVAGCSHMLNVYKDMDAASKQAKKGTPPDEMYEAPLNGGWLMTSLNFTKFNVAQYAQTKVMVRQDEFGSFAAGGAYLAFAAQGLPCEVIGSPIGSEANMGKFKSPKGRTLQGMMINDKVSIDTGVILKYLRATYGEHFKQNTFGYMSYTEMRKAPLPDPGWNTRRSALYRHSDWFPGQDVEEGQHILRLPSGLMVVMPKGLKPEKPASHAEGNLKGTLYELGACEIDHLLQAKFPSGDQNRWIILRQQVGAKLALFVTESGGTLVRTKAGGASDWGPGVNEIPVHEITDPAVIAVEVGTIGPDSIQQVAPRCFW